MKFHLVVFDSFSYNLAPEYQRYFKKLKISVWDQISTRKRELGLKFVVPGKLYMVNSHTQPQLYITGEGLGKERRRLENLVIPK